MPAIYGNVGGDIVNRPDVADWPDGYGWDGTATQTGVGFTDKPLESYPLIFSETNAQGERGHGIGTLTATVTIRQPEPAPNFSSTNSPTFDPRATVIYQDNTQEQYDKNVPNVNRQYFSLENPDTLEIVRDDPRGFLEKDYGTSGVILDEFQNEPNLLSYMQGIVDSKRSFGRFILTGSHNFLMNQAITQSLAGRVAVLIPFLKININEISIF